MKYIITFLMLLNYGYAQDKKADSLHSVHTGHAYMRMGSETNYMEYLDSTVIGIKGDTLTILRMLLSDARRSDNETMEAWGKVGYYMRQCKELIRLNDQILKLDRQITQDRIAKVKKMQATLENSTQQTKELKEGLDRLSKKLKQ